MSYFMISYDLIKNKDYKAVDERLESKGAHRILESVWVASFSSDTTAKKVVDWLKAVMDDDDKVVAVKFTNYHYVRAKRGTNKWFEKN